MLWLAICREWVPMTRLFWNHQSETLWNIALQEQPHLGPRLGLPKCESPCQTQCALHSSIKWHAGWPRRSCISGNCAHTRNGTFHLVISSPSICWPSSSGFVYHNLLATQYVVESPWSVAQLRRGRFRAVVYAVGSCCWWCGQPLDVNTLFAFTILHWWCYPLSSLFVWLRSVSPPPKLPSICL